MRNHKKEKYVKLHRSFQERYKGWVDFVPLVIGATGAVCTETCTAVKRLEIGLEIEWLQRIAPMETVNILKMLIN